MQITAIILAGGKSTRMGTDKALIEINGKSLLDNSIEICKPLFKTVLLSSNYPEHKRAGINLVADIIPDCGPLGGIYSCLKKSQTDWNFILSVDSPFVEPDFISLFISEIGNYDAIVPIHPRGKEPLIALYHKNCLHEIENRIKNRNFKMYDLLQTLNTKWFNSEDSLKKHPLLFRNINCQEDLLC